MGRDDGGDADTGGAGGAGGVEFVDDIDDDRTAPDVVDLAPHRLPRWVPLAAVGVIAAGLGTYTLTRGSGAPQAARPPVPASASASTTAVQRPPPVSEPAPTPWSGGPTVTDVAHPLLGGGTWELFGLGSEGVVRIQPGLGRVTLTPLPPLQSGAPVSFVTATTGVIVRPLDHVPGYEVRDGQPAVTLSEPLTAGPVFPGPAPGLLWRSGDDDSVGNTLVLTAVDGDGGSSQTITLPPDTSPLGAIPDGAGGVVVFGIGGAYDARPEGLRRITSGALFAVGPTGWVVMECDDSHRCGLYRIDRSDWSRHAIPWTAAAGDLDPYQQGVISPDGSVAAVIGQGSQLLLLDVRTGALRPVGGWGSLGGAPQSVVWAPDGVLLAVDGSGRLAVIDPRTAMASELRVPLPALTQLAIRPAPGE